MATLNIREHVIDADRNLYACDVPHVELKSAEVAIADEYASRPVRLIFGVQRVAGPRPCNQLAYVESQVEPQQLHSLGWRGYIRVCMVPPHIKIDRSALAAFRRRWKVHSLELFGSVLRPDFAPESDIDILVDFEPDSG